MTTQTDRSTVVRRSIDVDAPIDRAFAVFTHGMGTWWPPEHHVLTGVLDRMVLQPHVGGLLIDVAVDGAECAWGRVETWDPPHVFAFRWLVGPDWQVHPEAPASRVTVSFTARGGGGTHVELVHDELEQHGAGWEGVRDGVANPGGWDLGLTRYAVAAGDNAG